MKIKIEGKEVIAKIKRQFEKLEKRQRTLILLFIATALFSFYYNSVYKPQSSALRKVKVELADVTNRLTKLKIQIPDIDKEKEALNAAEKTLDFLKTQLSSLELQLPSQGRIPQLLGELVRQAQGYKVDFVSIRPKTAKANKEYVELLIEMKLSSNYSDFANYLNRLESLSPFLRTSNIAMEEMKDGFRGDSEITLNLATLLGEAVKKETEVSPEAPFTAPIAIERNPFVSKFRPDQKEGKKQDLQLFGVVATGEQPTAIINNEVYRVGDTIGNKKVKQILPNMVVLTEGREDTVLTLD